MIKKSTYSAKFNYLKCLSLLLISLGILVRLIQYLNNRSLWYDEANIAINIVNRSYFELLNTLDYNQAAPPGFLWVEKLSIQIFGNNEYALRLFPLIASFISLWAFYRLATRYGSTFATPVAIALFACGRYTIYYATELKQYSSDVMVTLLLMLLLIPLHSKLFKTRQIIKLSFVGAISIWFSHPVIFVLGGIELSHLMTATWRRGKLLLVNRLPIYLTWLISFSLLYFLTISGTMNNQTLADSWDSRYPNSFLDIVWFFDAVGRFFYRPLGFPAVIDVIGMVVFIIGCVIYWRNHRIMFWVLLSPFITTMIASYLHKYPFRERLVLFLAPLAMLIIAEGIVWLLSCWRDRSLIALVLGTIALTTLVLLPLKQTSQLIAKPQLVHEIRPVIEYISSHYHLEDKLYVYVKGRQQFIYYGKKYGFSPKDYLLGTIELSEDEENAPAKVERFYNELAPFADRERVWLLFSKDTSSDLVSFYLNSIGRKIDFYERQGAFVYLYDLGKNN